MQTQEPLHWSEDRRPLESRTDDPVLQFTENGQFKITVFSDFHFAEGIHTHLTQPYPKLNPTSANPNQTTKKTRNRKK